MDPLHPAIALPRSLLADVGLDPDALLPSTPPPTGSGPEPEAVAWARSGGLALTGAPTGPPALAPGRPATALRALADAARVLAEVTGGRALDLDGPALVGERAAVAGFGRRGPVTVGGAGHMLEVADGYVALNLARPSDVDLVPAWVGDDLDPADWSRVARAARERTRAELTDRAALLGLPMAPVADAGPDVPPVPWIRHPGGERRPVEHPLVVDLSALWAGPLCASVLGATGARVVKVEAPWRPDGARRGPRAFHDLLNEGKESVALDVTVPADRAVFDGLLEAADVVVCAWRPRVLRHLGIEPTRLAARGAIWIAITGYGLEGPWSERPAFGDDAAVAGGLVVPGDPPWFVADAVADPITGLAAAVAALGQLAAGRGAVLDVALVRAAAWARGPDVAPGGAVVGTGFGWQVAWRGRRVDMATPRARRIPGRAADLDAHGESLRAEFGPSPHGGRDRPARH